MGRLTKSELVNGFPVCYPKNNTGLPEYVMKQNPYREIVEKLEHYEDLQEQGRLLELEDKYEKIMIGQEIFTVHGDRKIIVSRKICLIKEWWNDYQGFQGVYGATPGGVFSSWEFRYEDLGKTVFLTKEEAEEALKRMGDGNEV